MVDNIPNFPKSVTSENEKYKFVKGWTYRNIDSLPMYWKVLYSNGEKEIVKYFYHNGEKLVRRKPKFDIYPPLKADELIKEFDKKFLIVPSEKDATCQSALNLESQNFIVTTLDANFAKSDLSMFEDKTGYYLPPKNKDGYKKAILALDVITGIKIIPPFPEWDENKSVSDYEIESDSFLFYIKICNFLTKSDLLELIGEKRSNQDTPKEPFLFMGFDEKAYYFIPQNQNIPLRIMRGNTSLKNNLEEIAPEGWWFANFNKENKDGDLVLNISECLNYIRTESFKRGIFDSATLLGVGPHRDEKKIVVNTGRSLLIYGNGEIEYNDYSGDLAFIRSKHRFEIKGKPWTKDERIQFIEQVNTFGFENSVQKAALVGWCATAPFASLFDFRPHIWITAKKGTGKSTLMERIVEPAIGPFLTKIEGKTSEAGIRQTIGRDSRPVLIDEFEANNKTENITISNILGLARSAYGGGEIIKGTPSHDAIVFKTKMTFCFSSIKTYFSNAADISRIIVINMKQSPGRMTSCPEMEGLRKMMFDRLFDLIENIKLAKKEILLRGNDERTGDTYGPLLAGYWMVISDKAFMNEEKFNKRMGELIEQIGIDHKQEDEHSVLDHILASQVKIDPSESKTIAEMLTEFHYENSKKELRYEKNLRRIGIRRMEKMIDSETKEVLAISCNHQEIKKILENTAFFEYKEVLSRHDAFIHSEKDKYATVYMAGKNDRAILLDWEIVENEFLKVPEGDDGIPF